MRRRKRRAPLDLLHLLRYAQSKVLDADWHRKEGLDAACKGPLTPSMHTTPNPVADAGGQSLAPTERDFEGAARAMEAMTQEGA